MPDTPTIAIVDDDEGMREALNALVHCLNYRPLLFKSAEDFLESADLSQIACMIVDVSMPGRSGLELQALLNARGARPPIIFMTSYSDDATRARALENGAAYFLGKPVDNETLIRCLRSVLAGA